MQRVFPRIVPVLLVLSALCVSPALAANNGITKIDQQIVRNQGGFPFKITESGSYKLTSNLVVPANTDGIDIQAEDVTLDLNGFTISGPIVCGFSGDNCQPLPTVSTTGVSALVLTATVRNGYVRGFSRGVKTFGGLVEQVQVSSNAIDGIEANDAVIQRSVARSNGGPGIQAFDSVVTDNQARGNHGSGFFMGGGGVFSNNTIFPNDPTADLTDTITTTHSSSCGGAPC